MVAYILKVIGSQTLFYLLYYLLFRKEPFFERNRVYLLLTLLGGFIIPLLPIPSFQVEESIGPVSDSVYLLKGITVSTMPIEQTIHWWEGCYILITGIMVFRFLSSLVKVMNLIRKNTKQVLYGYKVVLTNGNYPSASFLNNILWDETVKLDREDAIRVLQHEQAHIAGKHSHDILLIEALKAIMWFNPLVYLYASALRDQHEYIADRTVLQDTPQQAYRRLIVKTLFNELGLSVVHSFNQSQIQKRLNMMKKTHKPKYLKLKIMTVVPSVIMLLFMFSCMENIATEPLQEPIRELEAIVTIGDVEKTFTDEKEMTTWMDEYMSMHPTEDVTFHIEFIKSNWKLVSPSGETRVLAAEGIDAMAEPKEDIDEWFSTFTQNLEYPEEARSKGIEGTVVVKILINEKGNAESFQVLEGVDPILDDAAIAALEKSIKGWNPAMEDGKPIQHIHLLPVTFKL
ncbi:M56 family metallopeptidase [Limibacter armeniacum]|uniref:M56 family metallopeptidase n=1 Tax=Limibacter armeniacum TaxID=466084 RepID=UPI002FE54FA6